ncbi:MAG TPA: S41 family peptidase [Thermoleophilaceae bacterium]|nr:S41 family peptidase [Thermoleophilaceae bacterium]
MGALLKAAAVIVAAVALLIGGIWLGGHPESLPDPLRDAFVTDDRGLRAELQDAIQSDFYREVDDQQIEQGSLKGMVQGLDDRFSNYLTPKETAQFQQSVEGRFEGVGMNVDQDRRGLRVLNVFEGSPAERGGVKKGDFITEVDGRSIAGLSADVATARIKGPAGTEVSLELVDPDSFDPRTVKLKRARIEIPITTGRIVERDGKKLGIVTLSTFSEGAHGFVRKEIDELLDKGAEGILLDLRGNGGGLLDEAVLVGSVFIEDGLIVSTKGRTKPEREYESVGGSIDEDIPVVVLVDRGTASASEIVSGAIKDRGRGTVVGTRTFGKGVFQEVQPLSNGGLLDITVGQYFLPNGENIGDKGVRPTVKARDDVDTERDEALPIALDELAQETSGR